jgi:enoyl-CoA hydratase
MADDSDVVSYAADAGIATVTLDSPGNRNALSRRLVGQLTQYLTAAGADPGVRAVVLTHTGSTFCAGADLAEARAGGMEQGTRELVDLLRLVLTLPVPVIARVDGATRAGGLGILGACDIVVASDASTFAFTEVRIGLGPAIISLTTVPRMTSRAVSRYYLTGETFDAGAAVRAGLITLSGSDVDEELAPILAGVRLGSPQGLHESKRLAAAYVLAALDSGGQAMAVLSARLFGSPEVAEGMSAFLQRRPPSWLATPPDSGSDNGVAPAPKGQP